MYKAIFFFISLALLVNGCKDKEENILPAEISEITISPLVPVPSSPVIVSAIVKDSKGITSVKLYYAVGSGNFILVNMSASGDTYTGTIPAQPGSSLVQYYIEVVNTSSMITYAPAGSPATGASYQVSSAPVISNLKNLPNSPTAIDNVNVSAIIIDSQSIKSAKLYYKVNNGSYNSLTMNASSSTYSAIIPAQPAGSIISYYVEAINAKDISSISPETAPGVGATYSVNSIYINEVWSWGLDPDFDWIELYNSSNVQINIGGYKVYDVGGQSDATLKIRIPDGTIVPAKGFYTLIVDDPSMTPNFGLKKDGEEIWIENASGIVIDNFVYAVTTAATQSYGRKPDGTGNFFIFTVITKNTSNNSASTLK